MRFPGLSIVTSVKVAFTNDVPESKKDDMDSIETFVISYRDDPRADWKPVMNQKETRVNVALAVALGVAEGIECVRNHPCHSQANSRGVTEKCQNRGTATATCCPVTLRFVSFIQRYCFKHFYTQAEALKSKTK